MPESTGNTLFIRGDFFRFCVKICDRSIFWRDWRASFLVLPINSRLNLKTGCSSCGYLLDCLPTTLWTFTGTWIVFAKSCRKLCIDRFRDLVSECCRRWLMIFDPVEPVSCRRTVNDRLPSCGVSTFNRNLSLFAFSLIISSRLICACWTRLVNSSMASCFSLWIFAISSTYLFWNWMTFASVSRL